MKGNRIITRDLPWICRLESLLKADISNNKIHFLPSKDSLKTLKKLEFLDVSHNQVTGWSQLETLAALQGLKSLSCAFNPCTQLPESKSFLIASLPQLMVLDAQVIADFQRPAWTKRGLPVAKKAVYLSRSCAIWGPCSREGKVLV